MTPSFRPASARCGPRVVIARDACGRTFIRSGRSTNRTGCASRADTAGVLSTANSDRSTRSNAEAARPDRNASASQCYKTSSPASEPARLPVTNPHNRRHPRGASLVVPHRDRPTAGDQGHPTTGVAPGTAPVIRGPPAWRRNVGDRGVLRHSATGHGRSSS